MKFKEIKFQSYVPETYQQSKKPFGSDYAREVVKVEET